MIAFKTRQEDLEEQSMILDVLSSALLAYERTKNPTLEPIISFWEEELNKTQTLLKGDYSEKERRYNQAMKSLTAVRSLQ